MARRLAAIVFTDISGYTALAQTDESLAFATLKEQERLVRPLLATHHGRKVKSMGDGLLLEFPNALDAVEFSIDLQRHLYERNAGEVAPVLRLRVGIHLGDVQGQGTDILGDAVNIASRIEPLAESGGICLTAQVYDQVHNKITDPLERLGPKVLKGVTESIEIYRVVLPWTVRPAPSAGRAPPRLAVLPFVNISPDPEDEYFADGLTEELISVLSQIRGLRVTSRTSVTQFKGLTKSVAAIGRELGVSFVLEGSVRKSGERLRITVQLIDVRTDEPRWAQTYDRKLDDVFAIQAEVAEQTASALKVELLTVEREAVIEKPTANLEAYEAYLHGMLAAQRYLERATVELDQEATKHFEASISKDPKFGAAHAHYAEHLIMVAGDTRPWKEVTDRVRELATKALELSPSSSDAHVARGELARQIDRDWTRAEAEYQQAIALNPSDARARTRYGVLLRTLERFAESRKQLRVAIEQDPLNFAPRWYFVETLASEGDLEKATSLGERLLEDYPDIPRVRAALAQRYAIVGRTEDAVRTSEPLSASSDVLFQAWRWLVLALVGRPEEARTLLTNWEHGRLGEWFDLTSAAGMYAAIGDNERALVLLEKAEREGEENLGNVYQNPVFDPIRDDPRFIVMLRALKLPTSLTRSWRFAKRVSSS